MSAFPSPITIVAVSFVGIQLPARRTALGTFVESVGCNPVAGWYSGVSVDATRQVVYVFSAFCAGIAGLTRTANMEVVDVTRSGDGIVLDAVSHVVMDAHSSTAMSATGQGVLSES